MSNQRKETNPPRPISPRESDDPIAEEFREDLLQKPSFSSQSVNRLISDEDRLARVGSAGGVGPENGCPREKDSTPRRRVQEIDKPNLAKSFL